MNVDDLTLMVNDDYCSLMLLIVDFLFFVVVDICNRDVLSYELHVNV